MPNASTPTPAPVAPPNDGPQPTPLAATLPHDRPKGAVSPAALQPTVPHDRPKGAKAGAQPYPATAAVLAATAQTPAARVDHTPGGRAAHSPAFASPAHHADPSPRPLAARNKIKHYELLRPLGEGGMGQVFLARDTKLGRLVAIKRLLEQGDLGSERVLIEARATARCKHENIIVVYEVDEDQGEPYLVLEYIEGSTLRSWMAQRAVGALGPTISGAAGAAPPSSASAESANTAPAKAPGATPAAAGVATPSGAARSMPSGASAAASAGASNAAPAGVPPGVALELVVPVVRALVCAHEQGIVHRDLKPENILLPDVGPIKVVDFGIAKQLRAAGGAPDDDLSVPYKSGMKGTRLYMAPEQWRGEEADARVDLWAVGLMLYELCAGVHPLASVSPAQMTLRVIDPNMPMPVLLDACPEAGALSGVIERCLQKRRDDRFSSARELLAALEALRAGRAAIEGGSNPFVGLSAFQEADAARFFGRDAEVASATRMLRSHPLVAVVGASGAGKSSLVRAGVIPALKRAGERWEAWVLRPGRRPLAALAEVLVRASEAPATGESAPPAPSPALDALVAKLREQPGALGAELRARCRRRSGRAVVFVDQFEELYTLGADPEERAAFLACLEGVADDVSSPLRVLLTLRADFFERMVDGRTLLADVTRGLVPLAPMGRAGLREALERPLEATGYRFENERLVGQMLDALEGTKSPLPLMQFVASKLWEGRDRSERILTEESYERLGGVAGALSAHADAVLAALPGREQRLCREIFLRLVTPERTRAVVGLDELRELEPGGAAGASAVESLVHRLVEARLLAVESSGDGDGPSVELVHESLLDRWPQLGRWLEASQQDARFVARLRAAAQPWEASGEAEGMLWREGAAIEARTWLARRRVERGGEGLGLGGREERYLRAVVALSERARQRRRRAVAGVVSALGAVALVVSLLALRATNEATRATHEATRATNEATRATREATLARNATRLAVAREVQAGNPTTALGLVRELETPDVPRGWGDVAQAALQSGVSRVVLAHPDPVRWAAFSPDGKRIVTASADKLVRVYSADGRGAPLVLRGHEDVVKSAAFSPDGRQIVTTSWDKTVRVWPADGTGEPVVLRGHEARVVSAAFSPDGKQVVTASDDRTVRVWRSDGKGEPIVLRGHEGEVYRVAFSPDGQRVATASEDKTARVWRADGKGEPIVLRGHDDEVLSAAFSPDGRRLVTSSKDATVRVWHADGSGDHLVLRGHEGEVWAASFSPDGRRIVSASFDRTARLWNADGTGTPFVLRSHEGWVVSASFSPDGKQVVTASWDRTARVWDADSASRTIALRGHGGEVNSPMFSPDGRRVVTGSEDKTARVWNADGSGQPLILRGHEGAVQAVSFSPDGRRVVTASYDKTARVYSAEGEGEPVVLRGHEDRVLSASFSPDGRRIVTASRDKTARVWNADGSGEPVVLRGHHERVTLAEFLRDGRRVVTASDDATVRVWGADGESEPIVLRGHEGRVYSLSLSPDGQQIVTGSLDKTVRVWRADGKGEPVILRGHDGGIWSATFSPDGTRIVSASRDRTARVWRADGKGEPIVLRGHEGEVNSASFSPDGQRVVTASEDKTVRVWRADGTGEPLVLRGHEGVVSSAAFSPDGQKVLTGSADSTARVWLDLEPLRSPEAPTLWAATTYCPSAELRSVLLGLPEAQAREGERSCRLRVEAAFAAR